MLDFLLQEKEHIFSFWKKVYIFGSFITSKYPNDIDILLIYESIALPQSKIELKKLEDVLSSKFDQLEFDFLLLNESELEQTQFLSKVQYKQIK